jgi:RimJ/RimL family protein N-acetyltransferase
MSTADGISPSPVPDANQLLIRPIRPDDKQALLHHFAQLSERSRYLRFLAPHWQLMPNELRYLTEIDHHDHEALVAIDPRTNEGVVGVARYVRFKQHPDTAEFAVAVVDDWQCRGVGGRLAAALAKRAREEGIAHFRCLLFTDNDLMRSLAYDLGDVRVVSDEEGTLELSIDLA